MPPKGKPSKAPEVEQKAMSNSRTAQPEAASPVGRGRSPGARKEDWIANQLRRVYDDALSEAIPQDMLDLLNALDEGEAESGGK
jgi:hypothetical protein